MKDVAKDSWQKFGPWWLENFGRRSKRDFDGSWDVDLALYGRKVSFAKMQDGERALPSLANALPAWSPDVDVPRGNIIKVEFAQKAAAAGARIVGVGFLVAGIVGAFFDAESDKVRKLEQEGGLWRRSALSKMAEEQMMIDALVNSALAVLAQPALNTNRRPKEKEQTKVPRIRIHGYGRGKK